MEMIEDGHGSVYVLQQYGFGEFEFQEFRGQSRVFQCQHDGVDDIAVLELQRRQIDCDYQIGQPLAVPLGALAGRLR